MIQINCLNRRRIIFSFIISFVLSVVLLSLLSGTSYATGSDEISLQGKIVRNDSGYEGLNVVNGTPACVVSGADTCDFQIKYYSAITAGTLYLTETFSNEEIGDNGGIFNLKLGSDASPTTTSECSDGTCNSVNEVLSEFGEVYIEIGFAPLGAGSYTETFTRTTLNASAYAIRSESAEGSIADSFDFHNAASSSGITTTTGSVYYDTTDSVLKVYSGSAWVSVGSAGANAWSSEDVSGWTYAQYMPSSNSGGIASLQNFSLDTDDDRLSINSDQPEGGLSVFSSAGGSNWPLVSFKAGNSSFSETVLQLLQDGTGDIVQGYSGSTLSFQVDNAGDMHLANNGIAYFEPFASDPADTSLNPNAGEGCVFSYGGDLYWDYDCDSSGEELLNGASGSTLWTDGGTFSYLTSTTDDLVLGASTTGASKFFFDVSEGRLGIGTDTPSAAIDIAGASSEISNSSGDITIIPDDTFVIKANDTEDDVIFMAQDSSGTELFRIDGDSTNIGFGRDVLIAISTGTGNTASGMYSLSSNTGGSRNTASGMYSLSSNETGNYNTASGYNSLNSNTTGYHNTATGYQSIYYNTTGYHNTASGSYSLRSNETGNYNTAYGNSSGYSLVTGDSNVFLGYNAGYNETGSNKLYIANSNTTTPLIYGLFTGTGAGLTIHSQATDGVPLTVKGIVSQTENLFEVNTSADSNLLNIANDGTMTLTGNFATGTNNTYDIGTTTARMKDVYTQGEIEIGANGDSGNIRYNTTNDQLEFSNDGSTWIAMADAVKTVTLSAEYAGAVLAADGTTNSGSMTSDAEGSANNSMNYYEWESSETSLQDYDVRLRFTLPSDFSSWGTNAFTFNLATEANSATNNKVDFYVYLESSGSVDGSSTAQYSATAGVWKTTTIAGADLGDCNAAGETCLVLIRMYSGNDSYSRVGDIDINYTREL